VEGKVSAEGVLRITRTGVVRANVSAETAHIAGTVVGDVTASEGVEIETGGRLEGDITAPRVLLREGAAFLGQVAMGPVVATSMQVPQTQPADEERSALPRARTTRIEEPEEPIPVRRGVPARRQTLDGEAFEVESASRDTELVPPGAKSPTMAPGAFVPSESEELETPERAASAVFAPGAFVRPAAAAKPAPAGPPVFAPGAFVPSKSPAETPSRRVARRTPPEDPAPSHAEAPPVPADVGPFRRRVHVRRKV
jgi:hypothetical protein